MYQAILIAVLVILAGCGKVSTPTQLKQPEIKETTGGSYQTEQSSPSVQIEPFNITYKFSDSTTGKISSSMIGALVIAKLWWEQIIVEGLPDVNDTLFGNGEIDDLLVTIYREENNEVENSQYTLGSARPILLRRDSLSLPYYGELRIYPILEDSSYTIEDRTRVIMHELGHILGFTDYFLDRVGIEMMSDVRYFMGTGATEGYKLLLYYVMQEKLSYALPYLWVPLMNDSPHWRFPGLSWELMSPITIAGTKPYLTIVTILAMKDIGYVVDGTRAEIPPAGLLTKPTVGPAFICDGNTIWIAENSERR